MSDYNDNSQWEFQQQSGIQQPGTQQPYGEAAAAYYDGKKKKGHKWIFVLAGILLVIGGVAGLVMFVPSLRNRFELVTLSPESYYRKVEKRNLDRLYEEAEQQTVTVDDQTVHVTGRLEAGPLVAQLVEQACERGEISSQFELQELETDVTATKKGDEFEVAAAVTYGSQSLFGIRMLKDAKDSFYIQIPELNQATLRFTIPELLEVYAAGQMGDTAAGNQEQLTAVEEKLSQAMEQLKNAKLDTSLLKKISKRYSERIIEEFSDITREKNVTIACDELTQKVTTLTISLTNSDLLQIMKDLLLELQKDEEVYQLVYGIYPVTQAQYDAVLSLMMMALSQTQIPDTNIQVNLIVYVDMNGRVIGRGLQVPSSEGDVVCKGYTLTDGDRTGEYLGFETVDGKLEVHGVLTEDGKGKSGNIAVDGLWNKEEVHAADIDVQEVSLSEDGTGSGKVLVSFYVDAFTQDPMPEELGDLAPIIRYAISFDAQKDASELTQTLGIDKEGNCILSHVAVKLTAPEQIQYPTENICTPDRIEEYLENTDTQACYRKIMDAFGLEAEDWEY